MSTIAEHLAEIEMLHANRTEGVSGAMVQAAYMFVIVHYAEMIEERSAAEMAKARETIENRLREQHPDKADEHIENWRIFRAENAKPSASSRQSDIDAAIDSARASSSAPDTDGGAR
jgi:hypothetical protein